MSEQDRKQELPEEPAHRQTETVDSLEARARDDAAPEADPDHPSDQAVAGDDVVTGTDADEEQGGVSEPPG